MWGFQPELLHTSLKYSSTVNGPARDSISPGGTATGGYCVQLNRIMQWLLDMGTSVHVRSPCGPAQAAWYAMFVLSNALSISEMGQGRWQGLEASHESAFLGQQPACGAGYGP